MRDRVRFDSMIPGRKYIIFDGFGYDVFKFIEYDNTPLESIAVVQAVHSQKKFFLNAKDDPYIEKH